MSAPEQPDKKRDGSLPPGCKDLIDAIGPQSAAVPDPLRPITRRVTLPETVAVRYLAELLGLNKHSLLADMQTLDIDIAWDRSMSFDEAQKVLRLHGMWADKAN
jgi:hypothetical protein